MGATNVIREIRRATVSEQDQLSYLLAIRYLTAVETTFIVEDYHNGAGYDFFAYQD